MYFSRTENIFYENVLTRLKNRGYSITRIHDGTTIIDKNNFSYLINRIDMQNYLEKYHDSGVIADWIEKEFHDKWIKNSYAPDDCTYCEQDTKFTYDLYKDIVNSMYGIPKDNSIKKVIFNPPATIVFWNDGDKTVVKAENEPFDKEKGLAMAVCKKIFGNKGNYYNIFNKWIGE